MTLNDYLSVSKRTLREVYAVTQPDLTPDGFDLCFSAFIPAALQIFRCHRGELATLTEEELSRQIWQTMLARTAPLSREVN
jgi:hypothetical protein